MVLTASTFATGYDFLKIAQCAFLMLDWLVTAETSELADDPEAAERAGAAIDPEEEGDPEKTRTGSMDLVYMKLAQ